MKSITLALLIASISQATETEVDFESELQEMRDNYDQRINILAELIERNQLFIRQRDDEIQNLKEQITQQASEEASYVADIVSEVFENPDPQALDEQTSYIAQNTAAIDRITSLITGIESDIGQVNENFAQNTAQINTIANSITEHESDIADLNDNANICINDYLSKTKEYCGEWAGATIRGLTLFGESERFGDEININFEWPTQEDFDRMTPDVQLQSIDIWDYLGRFAAVQVHLSNGESSPIFVEEDFMYSNQSEDLPHKLELGPIISDIKSVGAHQSVYYPPHRTIQSLRFNYETDGVEESLFFNPYPPDLRWNVVYTEYVLDDDQELIGVYGVKDKYSGSAQWNNKWNNFSSLGFLVKQKYRE